MLMLQCAAWDQKDYRNYGDPIENAADMTPYRTVLEDVSTQEPTTESHLDLSPHPRLPLSSRSTLILSKLGASLSYFFQSDFWDVASIQGYLLEDRGDRNMRLQLTFVYRWVSERMGPLFMSFTKCHLTRGCIAQTFDTACLHNLQS